MTQAVYRLQVQCLYSHQKWVTQENHQVMGQHVYICCSNPETWISNTPAGSLFLSIPGYHVSQMYSVNCQTVVAVDSLSKKQNSLNVICLVFLCRLVSPPGAADILEGSPRFNLKTVKMRETHRKVATPDVWMLKSNFCHSWLQWSHSASSDRECLPCPEEYDKARNISSTA